MPPGGGRPFPKALETSSKNPEPTRTRRLLKGNTRRRLTRGLHLPVVAGHGEAWDGPPGGDAHLGGGPPGGPLLPVGGALTQNRFLPGLGPPCAAPGTGQSACPWRPLGVRRLVSISEEKGTARTVTTRIKAGKGASKRQGQAQRGGLRSCVKEDLSDSSVTSAHILR